MSRSPGDRRGRVAVARPALRPDCGPAGRAGATGTPGRGRRRRGPRRPCGRPPAPPRCGRRRQGGPRATAARRRPRGRRARPRRAGAGARRSCDRPPATAARPGPRTVTPREGSAPARASRSRASMPPPAPCPRTGASPCGPYAAGRVGGGSPPRAGPLGVGISRTAPSGGVIPRAKRVDEPGPVVAVVAHQGGYRVGVEAAGHRRDQQAARPVGVVGHGIEPVGVAVVGDEQRHPAVDAAERVLGDRRCDGARPQPRRRVLRVGVRGTPELVDAGHREDSAVLRVDVERLLLPLPADARPGSRPGDQPFAVRRVPLEVAVGREQAAPLGERSLERRLLGHGLHPRVDHSRADRRVLGPRRDETPAHDPQLSCRRRILRHLTRPPGQDRVDVLGGRDVEVGLEAFRDLDAVDLELLDEVVRVPARRVPSAHGGQPATYPRRRPTA